jgi:hypothetical protein
MSRPFCLGPFGRALLSQALLSRVLCRRIGISDSSNYLIFAQGKGMGCELCVIATPNDLYCTMITVNREFVA